MYDIDFIIKSQDIKQRIASGSCSNLQASYVFHELESLRSRKPYVFNIEITNACNMRCVMCPRTKKMTRSIQSISGKTFEKSIGQILPISANRLQDFIAFSEKRFGVSKEEESEDAFYFHHVSRCLTLHGYGESLIDPAILDRVSACTARGIPTYFSCVPSNIKVLKIKNLMEAGLTVIKFSIDSLDDGEQERIRGPFNNFTEAYQKIQELIKIKKENNYKTLFVATMIGIESTPEAHKMQKDFLKIMKGNGLYAYIKSQDNRWFFEKSLYRLRPCTKEYCEYPWKSLTIMADGSVVPCTQDYDCELVMGNVQNASLEEIWNSKRYQDFRKMHISGAFPAGHKCAERCDQTLVGDRLTGKVPKTRII